MKLKEYLIGNVDRLDNEKAKLCARIAPITKWMKVGCYFSLSEQRIVPKSACGCITFGSARPLATGLSTPLLHKSGRRASRARPNRSKDPLDLSLDRFIPECPTLCERMC